MNESEQRQQSTRNKRLFHFATQRKALLDCSPVHEGHQRVYTISRRWLNFICRRICMKGIVMSARKAEFVWGECVAA